MALSYLHIMKSGRALTTTWTPLQQCTKDRCKNCTDVIIKEWSQSVLISDLQLLPLFCFSTKLDSISSTQTRLFFSTPSTRREIGAVLAAEGASPPGLRRGSCPPFPPAAGATTARCYEAAPPSVPAVSLPGGWCPERRMTNAFASAY